MQNQVFETDREVITLGAEVVNTETRNNFLFHSNKYDKVVSELVSNEIFLEVHSHRYAVWNANKDNLSFQYSNINSMP